MIDEALQRLNIAALNEMQQAAIQAVKANDLVLLSPTGSGKTLAFLLPLLERLQAKVSEIQVLILVPSRELALQIESVFKAMGSTFKVNCFYGGHSFRTELNSLAHPPAVLVGTPGRIADHLQRGTFTAEKVRMLILDEFDKALELGFHDDMAFIISKLPAVERRVLTSATKMSEIPGFTRLQSPVELNFLNTVIPAAGLKKRAVIAHTPDKLDALFSLLCKVGEASSMVFCNHREAVERTSLMLWDRGLPNGVFHGGMEQEDRERTLIKFRNGSVRTLVTTDLASRGLDIPMVEHVIHYQLPHTYEAYVHRDGRTARMQAEGTSYLILAPDERPSYIKELPDTEELPDNPLPPAMPAWETLYLAAGRKDKINKIDIVGLLIKKGGLAQEELGRIEVLDRSSYVAVKRNRIDEVLRNVAGEKIKNKRVRIEVSK